MMVHWLVSIELFFLEKSDYWKFGNFNFRFLFSPMKCPNSEFYIFTKLFYIVGTHSSRNVTLKSIQLFTTHTYFPFKRSIFFQCKGEKLIPLPDVMAENSLYTFNGEESWQVISNPNQTSFEFTLYNDIIKSFISYIIYIIMPDPFSIINIF